MNGACTGMYASFSECNQTCASFPTNGVDLGLTNTTNWKNNVQCRIYHAGAPATSSATIHCPHAYVTGGRQCVDTHDASGYCAGYCQLLVQSCPGALLPPAYATYASCVTLCAGYAALAPASFIAETGWLPTVSGNDTVDCRSYHSIKAGALPLTHCPHASIDGGTICGTECGVYCTLANLGATGNECAGFAITPTASSCATDCAALNSGGTYLDTGANTLQCRIYHWAAAITLGTGHCLHGNPVSAVCIPAVTTTSASSTMFATLSVFIVCLGLLL